MNVIDLDASDWKTSLDFYEAILAAIGAPRGHGRNVNALIDSMIYGGINELEPPFTVSITNTENLPDDAREELVFVILAMAEIQGTDKIMQFQGTIYFKLTHYPIFAYRMLTRARLQIYVP